MEFDFKLSGSMMLLSVEDYIRDPQGAIAKIAQIRRNMSRQEPTVSKYQWTFPMAAKFAAAVQGAGIRDVKPKNVQDLFAAEGLKNHQIGSHLQKYKLKIIAEFGLSKPEEIQNWMCPLEFQECSQVQVAMRKWQAAVKEEVCWNIKF